MASNYLNWFRDKDQDTPLSDTIGDVVEYGFTRSIGFFDVYWDSVKASPVVMARDPFDLIIDRYGKYALRTYTARIDDIKSQKDAEGGLIYKNTDSLKPTKKRSNSDVYDNYLRAKYAGGGKIDDLMSDTMMEEFHILEQVDEPVKDDQGNEIKKNGDVQVRIITTSTDNNLIHN